MKELKVGLFNDSFPPTIDGVANVTVNYARIIEEKYGEAVVATPFYPDVKDEYPFKVIRYPSIYISKNIGYRAGYPFDAKALTRLEREQFDIIHTHCPFVSTLLARMIRSVTGTPIVFTYHTKFDIDIEKAMASDQLRKASIRFLVNNIDACDDVWVVSEGAGENLRSLGYKGEYIVMENGTDFSLGRSDDERIEKLREQYKIDDGETVFLFPSTFDTNGIVVREAAACYCPSLLIKGSCASERITDGETGVIIDETPEAMADAIGEACDDRERLKAIGENAANRIYVSWEDAVEKAYNRYLEVIQRHKIKKDTISLSEDLRSSRELIITEFNETKDLIQELLWDTRDWVMKLRTLTKTPLSDSRDFAEATKKKIEDAVERDERRHDIIKTMKKNKEKTR